MRPSLRTIPGLRPCGVALALGLLAGPAEAAGLDGASLGIGWAVPFVGLLLSIAILPQLAPQPAPPAPQPMPPAAVAKPAERRTNSKQEAPYVEAAE